LSEPGQIINQIKEYICERGGEYRDWYVGISDNPIDPVMEVSLLHKVQSHQFTYIETISSKIAKEVADYFVNTLGTDGNLNEKETIDRCQAIYVYKKAARTIGQPAP